MKLIEVVAGRGHADTIKSIGAQFEAVDIWAVPVEEDGRQSVRILLQEDKVQDALDSLQGALGGADDMRIVLLPVEAVLPRPTVAEDEERRAAIASREALYDEIAKSARLDRNYLLLVFLSTIVAAIGLVEDNLAVVVGAMVIAPLLGPNLALALATALGDVRLARQSLVAIAGGIGLAVAMSLVIGFLIPMEKPSHELLARTNVGLDSVTLALASGAAAVLSITTGLPSVLVGVMVAVALLPPAATLGLTLGMGHFQLAAGAGLLLAINVVCVNLAAKLVFLAQGIRPRTWMEKKKARQSTTVYIAFWVFSLLVLLGVIYVRR